MGNKKPVILYLDKETVEWLDGKVSEGYKKSSLIRHAVEIYRDVDIAAAEYELDHEQ
jgi:hypothetical protein